MVDRNQFAQIEAQLKARARAIESQKALQTFLRVTLKALRIENRYRPFEGWNRSLAVIPMAKSEFEEISASNKAEDEGFKGMNLSETKEQLDELFFVSDEGELVQWGSYYSSKGPEQPAPARKVKRERLCQEAIEARQSHLSLKAEVPLAPNFCAMTAQEAHYARLDLAIARIEAQMVRAYDPNLMDEEDWEDILGMFSYRDRLIERRAKPWVESKPLTHNPFVGLQL